MHLSACSEFFETDERALTLIILPSDPTQYLLLDITQGVDECSWILQEWIWASVSPIVIAEGLVVLRGGIHPLECVHLEGRPLELRPEVHEDEEFPTAGDLKTSNVECRQFREQSLRPGKGAVGNGRQLLHESS